jgi:AP endonuclease-2
VYAIVKDRIQLSGAEVHISDLVNPSGVFKDGKRLKGYSVKDIPALSAKLIPEFDRRRNIRDMFARKPSLLSESSRESPTADPSDGSPATQDRSNKGIISDELATPPQTQDLDVPPTVSSPRASVSPGKLLGAKRLATEASSTKATKRSKSASTPLSVQSNGKGQQSLKGFFKSKAPVNDGNKDGLAGETTETTTGTTMPLEEADHGDLRNSTPGQTQAAIMQLNSPPSTRSQSYRGSSAGDPGDYDADEGVETHDPIVAKESWSKLFSKRQPPKCEGHKEHCIQLTTKKPGINCGRAFWICPR